MSFASREKALLSTRSSAWASSLVAGPCAIAAGHGTGTRLEVLWAQTTSEAPDAERLGYVNPCATGWRAGHFVTDSHPDRLVRQWAIANTKRLVDESQPAARRQIKRRAGTACMASSSATAQEESKPPEQALQRPGDAEDRLGFTSAAGLRGEH